MLTARRLLVLFFTILLLLASGKTVYAADPPAAASSTFTTGAQGIVPLTSENYKPPQHADYTVENELSAIVCKAAGGEGCLTNFVSIDSSGKKIKKIGLNKTNLPGGAVGELTYLTSAILSTPPTSTTEYLADIGKNLGIKYVYAQNEDVSGSGANIIKPIKNLWIAFRNLAYIIFTIVFLIIGFMIMFRQKLNPQTVISVQSAIPGLIISLILITFSYLISALVIDIMFLAMQLFAQFFIQAAKNVFPIQEFATSSNVFNMFTSSIRIGDNVSDVASGTTDLFKSLNLVGNIGIVGFAISAIMGLLLTVLTAGFAWPVALVGLGLGGAAPVVVDQIGGAVAGALIPAILTIALAIQFFRLVFKLLSSYIMLLITTILGPMFILVGSVPGKASGMTGFWLKNLFGHALVFPGVFAVFLFAGAILATDTELWKASLPLFGGLKPTLLRVLIAYGIILGSPAVPDVIKKLVGAQDIGEIGKTGIQGFAGGFAGARAGAQRGWRRATASYERRREAYHRTLGQLETAVPGTPGADTPEALRARMRPARRFFDPRRFTDWLGTRS